MKRDPLRPHRPTLTILALCLATFACHSGNSTPGDGGGGGTPQYQVSGTLSGLAAGTVTLDLNGVEQLELAANGTFAFLTSLAIETDYTVTIVAQPARTLGTLTHATGTITGTVDDVQVTLEPGYTVGGTVSGLNGDTLQLQLDGGSAITALADGTFEFPDLLPQGAAYAVSIATPLVGRTVQLDRATGTVPAGDVTDVVAHARAWHHPTSTTEDFATVGSAANVAVAAAGDGDAVLAMVEDTVVQFNALYVGERADGAWTLPTQTGESLHVPPQQVNQTSVAMNADGDVILTWTQRDTTPTSYLRVFVATRTDGVWTKPASLNDAVSPVVASHAWYPLALIAANGDGVVVWRQSDGTREAVYASEFTSGVWTHPASPQDHVSPADATVADFAAAMSPTGDVCIAYTLTTNATGLLTSERTNGAWHHPASVSEAIEVVWNPSIPTVAVNASGDAVVAWTENDGNADRLFAARFVDGTWHHPTSTADALSPAGNDAWGLHAVVADDGSAVVFHVLHDGTESYVAGASMTAAGAWTPSTGPNDRVTPAGIDVADLTVAASAEGHVIVLCQDGNTNRSFLSERIGGTWFQPTPATDALNLPGHTDYALGQVCFDGRGNAFVARVEQANSDGFVVRMFVSEYR